MTARIDAAITATARELGFDVDALRTWVSQSVTPEDYVGVLRGARGSFLTRRANDADAATLLAALLDASLVPYRYAVCGLATMAGDRVADDMTAMPDSGQPAPTSSALPADDAIDELVSAVTDPELLVALDTIQSIRLDTKLSNADAVAQLLTALESAPDVHSDDQSGPVDGALAPSNAVRKHVWLQVANGPGWRDVDTTTSTGEPPCDTAEFLDQLPADWYHGINLALEVEQRTGTGPSTSDAFTVDLPTADIATARITFGFADNERYLPGMAWTSGELVRHTPVLVVDGVVTTGTPLHLPPSTTTRSLAEEAADALAIEPLGADDLPVEQDPITGAWLRIRLLPPGGPTTELRSEVFDRLGIESRVAGDANEAEVRPLAEVAGKQADLESMWQIAYMVGSVAVAEGVPDGSEDPTTEDGLASLLDGWLRVFPAVYRDMGGHGSGPVVLLAGLRDELGPDGETTEVILDALHVPGAAGLESAAVAVDAQAVVAAEQMLLQMLELEETPLRDAASVFAASRAQSIPLRWLAPGDGVSIPGASVAAQARMSQRLASGATLLTPATAPRIGGVSKTAWWTRDPRTGVLRDEHESGRHQAAENARQNKQAGVWGERFRRVGCRIARPLALAGVILYVASDGQAGKDFIDAGIKIATAADENRKRGEEATKIACAP